jgi:GNAT superfamily N-acetyltransferase
MSNAPKATLRVAHPGDAEAIARVHVESSEEAYAPLAKEWPPQDLAASTARWSSWLGSDPDPNRVDLVLELDGAVVAFVSGGSARRQGIPADVEIRVIHVLPQHRGKGFGDQLWSAATKALRGPDLRAMYLATLGELRCCSFYDAHGGEVVRRSPRDFHGSTVTDVVYVWPHGRSSDRRP